MRITALVMIFSLAQGSGMGILEKISRGRVVRPHLVCVYGSDKWGKSTFASEAPTPLFLCAEEGANNLDVARLPAARNYAEVLAALREVAADKHAYETLVIDTLDWLQSIIEAEVIYRTDNIKVRSIEDIPYGKGRVRVYEVWRELISTLDAVRARGMNIVLLAHAMLRKFEDPATPQGYDRYQLKLQSGANTDVAALVREYVDSLLFGGFDVSVLGKDDTHRGFGGERILWTARRPAHDAGTRFEMPETLPMVRGKMWSEYARHARSAVEVSSPERAGILNEKIDALIARVPNKDLLPKIQANRKAAGDDPELLARFAAKLESLVGSH